MELYIKKDSTEHENEDLITELGKTFTLYLFEVRAYALNLKFKSNIMK